MGETTRDEQEDTDVESTLYATSTGIGFGLMLISMTFNGWVIWAIVTGKVVNPMRNKVRLWDKLTPYLHLGTDRCRVGPLLVQPRPLVYRCPAGGG